MGSYHVQAQQLDELETLRAESRAHRARHIEEAILRVYHAIEAGIRPVSDDVHIVQQFIGQRTQQDRYGK